MAWPGDNGVNRERDENALFCAALTHELGQLLSTIGFTAETLANVMAEPASDEATAEAVLDKADRIRDSARRAQGVLRGLHDIFRRDRPVAEPTDLERVVDSAVAHFAAGHIPILTSIPDDLHMRGNAVLLELALTNLLKNSREAILRGTWGALDDASHRIEIEADKMPGHVRLVVRDTGGGVAKPNDDLLEPYVTTKTDKRGHGVGLWLVRRIVVHHGGTVSLRNAARGLEVTVTLPTIALVRESG